MILLEMHHLFMEDYTLHPCEAWAREGTGWQLDRELLSGLGIWSMNGKLLLTLMYNHRIERN